MPSLSTRKIDEPVKLMLVGTSGSGKTSALAELAKRYRIRILDLDNGLDSLAYQAQKLGVLDNIDYITVPFEKFKHTPIGPKVDGNPKVFKAAMQYLDKWEDDTNPAEWGLDTIFVLDSCTRLGDGAFEWAKHLNPFSASGKQADGRQWYKTAQDAVMTVISNIMTDAFRTNVILITHIGHDYSEEGSVLKSWPTSIGQALKDKLPQFFNTILLAETSGSGDKVKRTIRTMPTAFLDLKNPKPDQLEKTYPLETGLATIFEKLKGQ